MARSSQGRSRHRVLPAVAAAALIAGGPLATGPSWAVSGACWEDAVSDVNGGGPDVVVGLPSYDLPGKPDAGAIVVYSNVAAPGEQHPSPPTRASLFTAADFPGLASQASARFGAAVSAWSDAGGLDDEDDCADLLVGAPGQDVAGAAGAGQVYRLRGTAMGLDGVRAVFDEATLVGTGGAQARAGFGSSIAATTAETIAIGVPGRDLDGADDAGRVVQLLYRLPDAPDVHAVQQGGAGGGYPETGDRFGDVLTVLTTTAGPVVVVGVPAEDAGDQLDAGALATITANGRVSLITQDSPGAAGRAEAGDRYGAAIAGYLWPGRADGVVAVGVPGEDLGEVVDAGLVGFASFGLRVGTQDGVSGLQGQARALRQGAPGVAGKVAPGNRYGSAVALADVPSGGRELDLLASAPYQDLGGVRDAGMASLTRVGVDDRAAGLLPEPPDRGAGAGSRPGDQFGTAVSSVRLTRAPGEDQAPVVSLVTAPGADAGGVADAGLAYLRGLGGARPVVLVPPVLQVGAGQGMVPMR